MKELIWEITDECLNQCIHCSSCLLDDGIGHHLKVVSPDTLQLVAGVFKEHGFDKIVLSGGEPALHPVFANILEVLHRLGYEIGMYTSGVYPFDFFETISQKSLSLLSNVVVSFYSHKKEVHNTITKNEYSYDSSINTIKKYIQMGINVEANIVPMQMNQGHLAETAAFLEALGVSKVNVLKLVKQGSAEKNWQSISTNIIRLSEQITDLSSVSGVRVGNPFGRQKTKGQRCGAGHEKVCITFDGYVIPCEVFKRERYQFPNIYDDNFQITHALDRYTSLHEIVTKGKSGCYYNEIREHLYVSEVAA